MGRAMPFLTSSIAAGTYFGRVTPGAGTRKMALVR